MTGKVTQDDLFSEWGGALLVTLVDWSFIHTDILENKPYGEYTIKTAVIKIIQSSE